MFGQVVARFHRKRAFPEKITAVQKSTGGNHFCRFPVEVTITTYSSGEEQKICRVTKVRHLRCYRVLICRKLRSHDAVSLPLSSSVTVVRNARATNHRHFSVGSEIYIICFECRLIFVHISIYTLVSTVQLVLCFQVMDPLHIKAAGQLVFPVSKLQLLNRNFTTTYIS